MANKKISALTTAATPLAGTEVVPLTQAGGTASSTVANLTAGRPVTAYSYGMSIIPLTWGTNYKNSDSPAGSLWSYAAIAQGISQNWYDPANGAPVYRTTGAAGDYSINAGIHTWKYAASGTAGNPVSLINLLVSDLNGNLTFSTGNMVQGTAGKGLNFTANAPAAGKTSQLFSWYEEGTWAPVVTSGSGAITTVGAVSGTYVRNGRLVTVNFSVAITTNGTGATSLQIAGLPFTSSGANVGSGREINITGKATNTYVGASSWTIDLRYYDNTYPGGTGTLNIGSLSYFV